ncbi:putative leucine-rich repeat-containing protein DDB_G0290503 isoform X2 [Drosophila nasuta]|uniref:putative leucine-rich repeat-containing protein DDB_G0290503 isoform X2 n=1 Tax=Drosophila nasuta TaxID=42062 RepID=UPI00295EA10E|nr:putative leucine-rich repeat-containing protein DDB_G0290503 isoform X2 [Drosophila nasuta]
METLTKNIDNSDEKNSITTMNRHEITPENRASVLATLMEDDTDSENSNNIFKTSELTPDDRASTFSNPPADPHRPIVVETLTKNINASDVQNSISTVKHHEITPENHASVLATLMEDDTDSENSNNIFKTSTSNLEHSSNIFKLSHYDDDKLERSALGRSLIYSCDSSTQSLKSSEKNKNIPDVNSTVVSKPSADPHRPIVIETLTNNIDNSDEKYSITTMIRHEISPEDRASVLATLMEDDTDFENSNNIFKTSTSYSEHVSNIFKLSHYDDGKLERSALGRSLIYSCDSSTQSLKSSEKNKNIPDVNSTVVSKPSADSDEKYSITTMIRHEISPEDRASVLATLMKGDTDSDTSNKISKSSELTSENKDDTDSKCSSKTFKLSDNDDHKLERSVSVRTLNYNCDSATESLKSSEGSSLALQTVLDTQRSERFQCFNVSVETMADKESSASNSQPLGDPSTGGNIDIWKKTTECCVSTLADLLEDDRYSESSTKSSDEDEEKQLKYSDTVSIVIIDDTESSDTELESPNRYETSITYPIEISYAESSLTSQSTSDSQQCQHISEDSCTSEALSTENDDKVVQENNESFMQQISTLDSILEEEEVSSKSVSGTTARSTIEEFHRSGNIQKSDGSSQIEQRKKEKADALVLCELSPRLALSAEKVKLQSCEEKLEDSILLDNPLAQSSMIQSDEMNRSLSAAKKQIDELKQLRQRNSEQYETCRERTRELDDQSILEMRTQLRATGNQLSIARAQIVKLKKQISETNDANVDRNTLEQYENIVVKSQQKVLTLQAQKDASELKLASQLAKAERDLELAQKNQELAKQQLEEIKAQVEKLKEEHHKEVGELQEQKGALETENKAYLKDISTHCESIKKFKRQVASLQADSIIRSRIQSEGKSAEEIEKLKSDLKKSQEQFKVFKEQLQKVSLEKKELQSDKAEADSIIRSRIQSEEMSVKGIEKLKDLNKSQEQFDVVQKELLKVSLEKKELQSEKAEGDSIIRSRIQSEENSAEEIEKLKRDLMKSQEQFEVVQKELLKVSLEKKKLQRDKDEADSIIRSRIQSEEKSAEEIEKLKRDLMKSQEQFEVVQKELLKVSLEKKELQSEKAERDSIIRSRIQSEENSAEEIEKLKRDLMKSQEQFEVVQKELLKVILEKKELQSDKNKTESEEKLAKEIEKLKDDLKKSQEQFDVVNHQSLKVSLEKKNLEDDKGKAETFKSHGFKSEVEDMEKIKFDLKESEKQLKMVEKKLLKVFLEKEKVQDDKVKAETILKSRIHNEEKSAEEIEKLKDDLKKSQDQFEVVQKELQEVSLKKKELQRDKDEADTIIRSKIQFAEKSAEEIAKFKADLKKSQDQFEVVQKELQKVSLEKKELQSYKAEADSIIRSRIQSEEKSAKEIEKLMDDLKKSQDQFEVLKEQLQKVSLEKKELQSDKDKADSIIRSRIQSEEKSAEEIEKLKRDLMKSQEQFEVVQKELLKVPLEKKELQSDKDEADSIIRSRIQSEEKSAEEIEKLKRDLMKSQEQFEVVQKELLKVSLEKKELQSDKDEADSIIRSRIQSEEKSAEEIEKLKRDLMKSQKQFEVVQKELLKVILEKKELQSEKAEGDSIIRSRIQSEENSAEEIETLKADLRKSQEQFKGVKEQLQKVSLGNVKMSVQCEKGKTEVFGASSGAALPNELKQLSLTKITKQLPNLQKELIKTRKQLESMSEQLTDLSGENQKLRLIKIDDIRESTEAVNELLEKMNVTQKEFEKVRQELPQSSEEISRWLLSIDADLQIELTKAKQQRNAMEKRLFEQRIENKKLKKQLRRFKVNERKTIEEQSKSRKNIDIWKKRAEFAREETQRTRDALLTQIHELHKDKDVLNGEKMAMEKKQKDREERILQLNEQLKKKSQQLNDSQQSNVSLSEIMERLQLDQSVRDQNEVKAKEDRMVIQHSLQSMTAALQVANSKLKKSQCEIQCMEEKTTELNLEIGGLNLNISQAKVRETALKESLEKTNQKVCELKEKIKYARAQREECEHSKSLIKMLNTDLNKLQSSYDKQHFSINTMLTRMQQLQNDCQTLQDQNQELQQYIDSANEREKTLCTSLATINKEFELERANNIALKIELETNQITLEQTRNHSKLLGDLQERYNALKSAANADEKENVEKIARLRNKLRKIDMLNDRYLKALNYWKSHAEDLKNEIECQKQKLSQANKFRIAKME